MRDLSLKHKDFAHQIGVSKRLAVDIVHGKRPIRGNIAYRLGLWFGTGADFWIKLQDDHEQARTALIDAIAQVRHESGADEADWIDGIPKDVRQRVNERIRSVNPLYDPVPPHQLELPRWVAFLRSGSGGSGKPSIASIAETCFAIVCYWSAAIYFETYLPLVASTMVAPLVLLRSGDSVALGARWFMQWERRIWRGRRVAGARGFFGLILCCVLAMYLVSPYLKAGITNKVCGIDSDACNAFLSIFFALLFFVAAVIVIEWIFRAQIFAARLVPEVLGANIMTIIFRIPLYFGMALGIFIISVLIRVGATLVNIRAGFRALPDNFRRLVLCTPPLQEPEMVPGLVEGESEFTLAQVIGHFQLRRRAEKGLVDKKVDRIFAFAVLFPVIVFWFVPAWLYRVILKSTAWFWWPLAFLGSELRRLKDPESFHRRVRESLWAKTVFWLSIGTLAAFLLTNLLRSGELFEPNPVLTVLGYFFRVDWSLYPWQLLTLVVAAMSVGIVYWMDAAGWQHQQAVASGDQRLILRARRGLGWIERVLRLRLLLVIVLWFLVATQTALYFNADKCWFNVPDNAARWAHWAYGDRMPQSHCVK